MRARTSTTRPGTPSERRRLTGTVATPILIAAAITLASCGSAVPPDPSTVDPAPPATPPATPSATEPATAPLSWFAENWGPFDGGGP